MRILVNYHKDEQNFLPILQYHLKARRLEAIATNLPLTIGELLAKAKNASCQAILICNEDTLKNCVPGDKPTLDDYRGSLLNFSVPTIVCNALAHAHTVDHGAWLLGKDLDKFLSLGEEKVSFNFTVLETANDMEEAFFVLKESVLIAYDIETVTLGEDEELLRGGETVITCCSWSAVSPSGKITTYTLPFVDYLIDHWVTDQEYIYAIRFMQRVNALEIPKVMHNGVYDCLHSIVYHAEPVQWILDTMAMMHSEFSSLPKDLSFVASITLPDYCQWKGEAKAAAKDKDIHRYWGYNAKDTWTTARICLHYLKHLPAYAKKNYATQFKLVYPCLYMSFEGILIDQGKRISLREEAFKKQQENLSVLRTMFADPNFNPGSYKQVQIYIYDVFGAADPHIGKKKVDGRRTKMVRGTDEKNLRSVGEQHPLLLRITEAIISYREAQKAIGTYFDFYQRNSRLLYTPNPFGTDTDRMSCSASSFWCGTQIQNIPPYAKEMLISDEGYVLEEFDNSQSEARCTAYLSQEENLIKALENKEKDFYKTLGTLFFGIPYEEVTKEFRNNLLKKIVHGTNYMMGAVTFIENAGAQNLLLASVPLKTKVTFSKLPKAGEVTMTMFATQLLESYHKPFPRVRMWYAEQKTAVATSHMLISPLGNTRYFFGDVNKSNNMLRSVVAHGPQNLSVTILNKGLWKVWQLVKKEKGALRLKAQIHDSIFTQRLAHRTDLTQTVRACMDNPVIVKGRTLRIPVDYKDGISWGSMIEHKG
jgi:DNA polymerase I-like protein with 3'-5' exonuclease and polymerase domains